jgi:hypothetical protein
MSTKTITITPNYNAIFEMFLRDAGLHLGVMSRTGIKSFSRREVYNFVASLRIALGAATTVENVEALRDMIDKGAEAMFVQDSSVEYEEGEGHEEDPDDNS